MTMNKQHVVAELRRDAAFVRNAVIAVLFVCFASLAVGAALIDLFSIRP
jgi:hypothetical protein